MGDAVSPTCTLHSNWLNSIGSILATNRGSGPKRDLQDLRCPTHRCGETELNKVFLEVQETYFPVVTTCVKLEDTKQKVRRHQVEPLEEKQRLGRGNSNA